MSAHHHSHHHHNHTHQSLNLAFSIAVICNLGFTVFELIYALLANSMALLADAAHNFGDVLGLLLAWGANWLLTLPSRKRYSYGFKRTTILAAIINALILVTSAGLIAFESVYKLLHVSSIHTEIVIVVALIGIVINGGTALLFMKGSHSDLNIKGAFIHLMSDAVIAMGVVISGVAIYYTNKMWIDSVVGLIIVITMLWSTWGLLRDSISLILDAIPRYIDQHGITTYLKQLPGVTAVHDLHIWGLSTKEVALTAHLVIAASHLAKVDYKIDYHVINTVLKDTFHINHITIQVESENSDYICVSCHA